MANKRNSRNNNPEGKNQYSGWRGSARDNPLTAAAAVGGAVAAGVFLWSRRNQISEEIGRLGEQIGEWRESIMADDESTVFESNETAFIAKSQREIAEEALTLRDSAPVTERPIDPMVGDQIKVGTVAY